MSKLYQCDRPNPQRPTVAPSQNLSGYWYARGYDANGKYHVKTLPTLQQAHDIATDWATNGYPGPEPEHASEPTA